MYLLMVSISVDGSVMFRYIFISSVLYLMLEYICSNWKIGKRSILKIMELARTIEGLRDLFVEVLML